MKCNNGEKEIPENGRMKKEMEEKSNSARGFGFICRDHPNSICVLTKEQGEQILEMSGYKNSKYYKESKAEDLFTPEKMRENLATLAGISEAELMKRSGPLIESIENSMATYFDKILGKRGLNVCPTPLWKLKITDEEYDELKKSIKQFIVHPSPHCSNPFITITRECALFYAEYWRREFSGGLHNIADVYKSLEPPPYSPDNCECLYDAAKKGAKRLNIEWYSDDGRTQRLDSIFYQGGLPMKLVTDGTPNSIWDNFVRGLVNRNVNFEDLRLGIIASNSNSLKEFCDQIIAALDAKQFMRMPFHCGNKLNSWFVYLQELREEEIHRQRLLHPFSLNWEFRIDTVGKRIYTKFVVTGRQRLPQPFIEENKITKTNFFSVQVNVNGKEVNTFDYVHNFCRYEVISKHSYHTGEAISIFVGNNTTPVISDQLDMSVPHLLYRNNVGKYELGNRIGRQDSFLLIPGGWKVKNSHGLCIDHYQYEGKDYDGIQIPTGFTKNIEIESYDGILTFGCSTPLYWTELNSIPVYTPNITETLYDAKKAHFSLCNDMMTGQRANKDVRVEYRSKWDSAWKTEPGHGEIFARAIDANGHFVTPVKFINIGNGLKVNVIYADEKTCKIQVVWEHGQVATTAGVKRANDVWEINKAAITNNKVRFSLTPKDNSNNQFDINVKAPFKEFSILDTNDNANAISSDCWIPYSDIGNFKYRLIGQDIREYTYGGHRRQLKWIGEELHIVENNESIKSIPYEGSLLLLFDSREELRLLLGRTSQNMLRAEVNVRFLTQDGQGLQFAIKDSPFRPLQLPNGKIVITSKDRKPIDYKGNLELLNLDDPLAPPETLVYDETKGYILPGAIRPWGKALLVGHARGRICPALVNLAQQMTGTDRLNNRENTIRQITESLDASSLGDKLWQRIIGWFHRAQDYDIPASSLLELHCVAQSPRALMCLAFQLFAQCNKEEEIDILAEQLKSFSADLAFSWYWLAPHLKFVTRTIDGFVHDNNSEVLRTIHIKWAMRQGEKAIEYLGKYEETIVQCIVETIKMFDTWMKKLCVDSLVETYDYQTDDIATSIAEDIIFHRDNLKRIEERHSDYIDVSQDYIDEVTSEFFNNYREEGKTCNEDWMWKRINAVAAHLRGTIDLFAESDEIRRSVIFCSKSCNRQFIINLNNKLL